MFKVFVQFILYLLAGFQQLPDILQSDAVLPAHPCHRARRQQLAARTRTQFCQLAAFTTQPTTEGIATHSCGICQLILIHRFHTAKVRKNFELRKQVGNYLPSITINNHQRSPMSSKEHQRHFKMSYLCIVK